jgi:hypothetical protein
MATASAAFDKYKLWYYSSYPLNAYYEALIYCYQGSTFVGRIEFYKAGTPADTLKSQINAGQPFVRYKIDRFPDVYQILLHEKPLSIFVNDSNGIGLIGTDDFEPTGEEE